MSGRYLTPCIPVLLREIPKNSVTDRYVSDNRNKKQYHKCTQTLDLSKISGVCIYQEYYIHCKTLCNKFYQH